MTRLDRYILRHLVASFGFFVLIFTGVIWLTQAVRLIDTVVASGQSARVFLTFSALVLPQVFVIVLPLSGLGAALQAGNRLWSDSELTVMMAAGLGPVALLRPAAAFGGLIAAAMALVTLVFVPLGGATLAARTQAIRSDIANALVVERQFLHPLPGLTLFIDDTARAGEMAGIFLNDQRDPQRPITYSAERALLVRDGDEARLVMLDGLALTPGAGGEQLDTVRFDQFVFDLSALLQPAEARVPRPSEYAVPDLLSPSPGMLARERYTRGDYVAEGHYKLAMPALAATFPLVAFATLLAGGYRRSGIGRRVFVAIGVAAALQITLFLTRARVQDAPELWPSMYLPVAIGGVYAAVLTLRLARGSRPRRTPA